MKAPEEKVSQIACVFFVIFLLLTWVFLLELIDMDWEWGLLIVIGGFGILAMMNDSEKEREEEKNKKDLIKRLKEELKEED